MQSRLILLILIFRKHVGGCATGWIGEAVLLVLTRIHCAAWGQCAKSEKRVLKMALRYLVEMCGSRNRNGLFFGQT